jgi:hypothetical protein
MMRNYLTSAIVVALVLFTGMVAAQQDVPAEPVDTMMAKTEVHEETAEEPVTMTKFTVESMACGTAVEDRELQGQADTFPMDTEKVYCWCLITGCEEQTTIEHVWYYGGEEIARVPLEIPYPRMRTWSSKTMMPEWAGDWKVELVDDTGKALSTVSFKLE